MGTAHHPAVIVLIFRSFEAKKRKINTRLTVYGRRINGVKNKKYFSLCCRIKETSRQQLGNTMIAKLIVIWIGINSHYFRRIQLEGSQHETIDVRTKELFYQ